MSKLLIRDWVAWDWLVKRSSNGCEGDLGESTNEEAKGNRFQPGQDLS